jgi:hypothetical protein
MYKPQHKAILDELLLGMVGVTEGTSFGYPAYKVYGKVFAFVGGEGIAIRLPHNRLKTLIARHPEMRPFEPEDVTFWQNWVSIDRTQSEDYWQDLPLLEESVNYVMGGSRRGYRQPKQAYNLDY